MKTFFNAPKLVLLLAVIAATIGFSAFRQKDSTRQKSFRESITEGDEDTTRNKRNRSKDECTINELSQAMKELDQQMNNLDKHLKSIDFARIEKQVNEELKKVDLEKIGKEMEMAMKEVDVAALKAEFDKSAAEIKKIDTEKLKKEMEKVKVELEKHKQDWHINHEKMQHNLKEEMQKVKEKMKEASESMHQLSALTSALHKDKLIDKENPYSIEVKDGDLYINGTKQSQEISDKYRFIYQKKNFSIHK
jgi:uncharacterized protein HemX